MGYDKELRRRQFSVQEFPDHTRYERHYDGILVSLDRWDFDKDGIVWDAWLEDDVLDVPLGMTPMILGDPWSSGFRDHREALAIAEVTVAARLEAGKDK